MKPVVSAPAGPVVGVRRDATVDAHTRSIERVIARIRADIETPHSVDTMADVAALSPYHFIRVFRAVTGVSPMQFLYAVRFHAARNLILTTRRSITEICFGVGYSSHGTFTTRFRSLVGISPSELRRSGEVRQNLRIDTHDYVGDGNQDDACTLHGIIPEHRAGTLVAVGAFRSPMPVGQPAACEVLYGSNRFSLSLPASGGPYFILAAAVPLASADAAGCLSTVEPVAVGRVGPIAASRASFGDVILPLRDVRPTDPPLLFPVGLYLQERLRR
jgi:AraC-like DNA-binding protein